MPDLIESLSSKVSAISELAKRMGNPEFMLEISDLKLQLADVKTAYASLQNEIRELKAEADEQANNPLRYSGVVYHDAQNHPYCPPCFDDRKKRIHLKQSPSDRGGTYLTCPVCKEWYEE
jgi:hypothetical protein